MLYHGIMVMFFPVMLIWGIFALIKSQSSDKQASRYIYNLLEQVKKSSEASASIGQSLINTENELKKGFVLQEFSLLISDINEILSDIIKRSNSISSSQLEHLWTRTTGGERWILAKTFIEITNYQSEFINHLTQKAAKDHLLKGSILEFHARYKTIQTLLNTNKTFYNMVEYGAIGKVFDILTPIVHQLSSLTDEKKIETPKKTLSAAPYNRSSADEDFSIPSFLSQKETSAPSIANDTTEPYISKNTEPNDIDAGLRAIRNEILSSSDDSPKEPQPSRISTFSQTQLALRSIKNTTTDRTPPPSFSNKRKTPVISLDELEKEINASPENNYDEYAYPFGAWSNGKNNK